MLKTTTVKALAWWIGDYDHETKSWYEKSYPLGPGLITGIIAGKENPELSVDLSGVPAKDGIDVYMISIKVAPAANQAVPACTSPTRARRRRSRAGAS